MEGVSLQAYKGIRRCWRKRGYQRLNGPPDRPQSGGRRRVWRWRIRVGRKIRLGSPRKWLAKLRDAYVKMMLSFAGSASLGGGYGAAAEYGGFGRPAVKEYDEKRIVEIYKSVLRAQGQTVVRDAPKPRNVACYVA